jgi:hypothetical protein
MLTWTEIHSIIRLRTQILCIGRIYHETKTWRQLFGAARICTSLHSSQSPVLILMNESRTQAQRKSLNGHLLMAAQILLIELDFGLCQRPLLAIVFFLRIMLLLPFCPSFCLVPKLPVYESRPLSNSHASHTENPALLTLFT